MSDDLLNISILLFLRKTLLYPSDIIHFGIPGGFNGGEAWSWHSSFLHLGDVHPAEFKWPFSDKLSNCRYDHWQAETEKTEIKLSWTVRNYFSLIIIVVSFFLSMCGQCSGDHCFGHCYIKVGIWGPRELFKWFLLVTKNQFPNSFGTAESREHPSPHMILDRDPKQNPLVKKTAGNIFWLWSLRASRMIITAVRNGELQLLGSCLVTPLLTTGQLPDIVHRDIYLIYHMLLWLGDLSENDQLRN